MWLLLPWLALAALVAAAPARAGTVPGELPGFVGRLSTVQGDVRWYDRDSGAWLGGTEQPLRNWPLAAGDRLRTGTDARAELRVGGTTVRLGAGVDLTLQQLDAQRLTLWLQSGSVAVRLPKPLPGDVSLVDLHTPEGHWLPLRPGHYRLDRQTDARSPATQASVWRGELRFEGPDSVLVIPSGRRADLWQDRQTGATRYAWAALDRDAFADWVARDERQDDAPLSARHVPVGMSGWQDLDRHGDWVGHPELGSVWQPRAVAPGWAPFHDGRWAWVAPWGWTWIDAAPWGFAPFHYGSWLVFGGRWCWSPGPRHQRPQFAPVLSGWVSAPQHGVGIQIGGHQHRPPLPRVVVPVAPPPVVVVLPPRGREHPPPQVGPLPPHPPRDRRDRGDRGDGHHADDAGRPRPDVDPHRPGWHTGRAWDEQRDGRDHRDARERRDSRDDRDSRDGRDRRDGPSRGDRPDRSDRPDRHHVAEPAQRAPIVPTAPPASPVPVTAPPRSAGPAPMAAQLVVAPAPPVPAVRPLPPAAAVRADSPPAPGALSADAPGRPVPAGRPDRAERSEAGARGPRHESQAWR